LNNVSGQNPPAVALVNEVITPAGTGPLGMWSQFVVTYDTVPPGNESSFTWTASLNAAGQQDGASLSNTGNGDGHTFRFKRGIGYYAPVVTVQFKDENNDVVATHSIECPSSDTGCVGSDCGGGGAAAGSSTAD